LTERLDDFRFAHDGHALLQAAGEIREFEDPAYTVADLDKIISQSRDRRAVMITTWGPETVANLELQKHDGSAITQGRPETWGAQSSSSTASIKANSLRDPEAIWHGHHTHSHHSAAEMMLSSV